MEKINITAPVDIPFDDLATSDAEKEELHKFYYEHIHIYYEDLYRWIMYKAPKMEAELVKEVHQETIARALECRNQLRNMDSSKTWLFSIAANVVAAYYRIEKKQKQMVSEEFSYEISGMIPAYSAEAMDYTLEEVLEKCESLILMECLMELSEEQQYVIRMHHFRDMKFREIAEKLGENPNKVYGWYRRGCIRLRRLIKKKGG